MSLSLEDISTLDRLGFSQFDIAGMTETETNGIIDAVKNFDQTGPDSQDKEQAIWGLDQARG